MSEAEGIEPIASTRLKALPLSYSQVPGKRSVAINYITFEWKRLNAVLFDDITINHCKQ